MTDIVDKLNGIGWANSIGYPSKDELLAHAIEVSKEAAIEIERLREENEKLKERITELGWIESPERMGR